MLLHFLLRYTIQPRKDKEEEIYLCCTAVPAPVCCVFFLKEQLGEVIGMVTSLSQAWLLSTPKSCLAQLRLELGSRRWAGLFFFFSPHPLPLFVFLVAHQKHLNAGESSVQGLCGSEASLLWTKKKVLTSLQLSFSLCQTGRKPLESFSKAIWELFIKNLCKSPSIYTEPVLKWTLQKTCVYSYECIGFSSCLCCDRSTGTNKSFWDRRLTPWIALFLLENVGWILGVGFLKLSSCSQGFCKRVLPRACPVVASFFRGRDLTRFNSASITARSIEVY